MYLGFEPSSWAEVAKSPVTLVWLVGILAMFAVTGNTLDPDHLSKFGATDRTLLWNAEVWRLFTSGLLHYGFGHLFWNAVVLPGWGARVERELGSARTAIAITTCTIAASSVSLLGHHVVGAGASGGLLGLMGVTLVLEYRLAGGLSAFFRRSGVGRRLFAITVLFATGLALTDVQGFEVDNWAHAGGLGFGLLLGVAMTSPRRGLLALPAVALVAGVVLVSLPQVTAHGRWQTRYDAALEVSDYAAMIDLLEKPPLEVGREWPALQLAWAHLGLARPEQALAAIDAVLDQGPPDAQVSRRLTAALRRGRWRKVEPWEIDARRFRALALHQLNRNDEALTEIHRAISDDPVAPWPRYVRALIYNATNREVEAQQDLEVAMAAEQHVDFYEARYQSRLALKDWEGALADIAVCERLAMAPVKSVGLRGWVEYWRADLEAASAHFDAALKLDPKDGSALCGRCQLLERQGAEPDALIDACTLAIDAMPNHLETWLVRSKAHQAKEDFKLAAQDADAVLALDSTHVQAALSRAWISLLDEDFDDAKRRSAELLVRFPDDVSAIVLAGELALHDEDLPEAKKHFERALKLAPEGWNYTERVIEVLAAMRPVR